MHGLTWIVTFSLVALAGCPPPDPNDPARAAQRCTDAAATTEKILQPSPSSTDPDAQGNFRAVIGNRCAEDRWSDVAIDCTRNAIAAGPLRACWYKHLSQEQQDKVTRAAASMGGPGAETPGLGVTAIEPAAGPAAGNTKVTIKGARFVSDGPRKIKVFIGEREATVVKLASDTELVVQTPPGKIGDVVDVRLQFDPGGEIVMPKAFTFQAE